MKLTTRVTLVCVIGLVSAAIMMGLAVYPFQYGLVDSLVLAGLFAVVAIFKLVLDAAAV